MTNPKERVIINTTKTKGGFQLKYRKEKLNAMRFFLAQKSEPGLTVRERVMRLRNFRTDAAEELFNNPFSTDDKAIYVLGRLCDWADVIFPDNWEMFATPKGVEELAKIINKQPYNLPDASSYTERCAYLQQLKLNYHD